MNATDDLPNVTVHLVRHGQVDNPDGILYGCLPGFGLTPLGVQMAQRVAQWSSPRRVVAVVSSPLERAQQTAAPIAAAHGLTVQTDQRLIEAANAYQGSKVGSARQVLAPRHWWRLRNPLKPSWGEPYADQVARMMAAVQAARLAAAQTAAPVTDVVDEPLEVICVSHQLPIWLVRRRVEGRRLWHDPRRRQCTLASVTSLQFGPGGLLGLTYQEPAADLLPVAARSGVDAGVDLSATTEPGQGDAA